MGAVVCFDSAAQAAHQDRIDAADKKAALLDVTTGRITTELVIKVLAGLNDTTKDPCIDCVRYPIGGVPKRATQSMIEVLDDALDHLDVLATLRTVLAESVCPRVATLKVAIARAYASDNAAALAELECGE
jgi:hypothetical protein